MKKILMLLVLTSVASLASAQSSVYGQEAAQSYTKYQVLTNPFWSNWFISAGGGAQVTFGNTDHKGAFKDRVVPTLNVAVGKWFTPGLGLRLQYSGLQSKGFASSASTDYVTGGQIADGYYKQKFDYMNLHADMLFNFNAMLGGYNENRVYELIPYVGFGMTHAFSNPNRTGVSANAGLINRFRLSSALDINLELSATGVEDKFDGKLGGDPAYDAILGATLGLTYRFPCRTFNRPAAQHAQLISEGELQDIRSKMNEMALANTDLQSQLAIASNQPVVAAEIIERNTIVAEPSIAPHAIFFALGSSKVSEQETMNLGFLADQMKQFPNLKFSLVGYADAKTGTAETNRKISLKRAEAVIDVLVARYNIDRSRLSADSMGGVEKFGADYLNRVVLISNVK